MALNLIQWIAMMPTLISIWLLPVRSLTTFLGAVTNLKIPAIHYPPSTSETLSICPHIMTDAIGALPSIVYFFKVLAKAHWY